MQTLTNRCRGSFRVILLICCLILSTSKASYSQTSSGKNDLSSLVGAMKAFRDQVPQEKIYLHLDKPWYFAGDTLWFKLYCFEANFLSAATKSGICYLEVANERNVTVKRMMLPVVGGLSWGQLALAEKEFPEGGYTLRAYTNAMRNFGEELIFQRHLDIYDRSRIPDLAGSKDLTVLKSTPNPGKAVQSPDAKLMVNLQLMPEGGQLVCGIKTLIGFKATDEQGNGVQVEGKIVDSKQQTVTTFSSFHDGMGAFSIVAEKGESYSAVITSPGIKPMSFQLPKALASGTHLSVNPAGGGDSLRVTVSTTPDPQRLQQNYWLVGHARGVVCFAKVVHPGDQPSVTMLARKIFPVGVVKFTLLNENKEPVNERMLFIDRPEQLSIKVTTDKPSYLPHDSVALQIRVTDHEGQPVQGSFSLAVTDDRQVVCRSESATSLNASLWLTSELKGIVAEPLYYLSSGAAGVAVAHRDSVRQALDLLMLTQGGKEYPWQRVISPKEPEYAAEPEFMIRGRATNSIKGIPHTRILLYSRNPFLMIDTLTDQEGRFCFKNLHLKDTASFLIQSLNRNGRSFLNNIAVDEFKPPLFSHDPQRFRPFNFSRDTLAANPPQAYNPSPKQAQQKLSDLHVLDEVLVSARKVVKGSKSLNGPGNADQVMNTQDLQKLGKMSLLEVLKKQIKGFRIKELYKYYIDDRPIHLVMDGLYVDTYDGLFADEMYNPLKDNFESYTAEDLLGIEVMTSPQYNSIYNKKYLSTDELRTIGGASGSDYAWLEITTRSGRGAYMKHTPGVMLYKPMAFSLPLKFYSPHYPAQATFGTARDQRSTIYWNPSVVTDQDGKATLWFFAADNPSTYSITMEGSDMLGGLGSVQQQGVIQVKAAR